MNKIASQNKILFFLSLFLCSIFINSCEKSENQFKIRINQFKQTAVAEYGPIVTLSAQEGNEIGSANWSPLYNQIIGFDYEIGYVYDLLVAETEILNPNENSGAKAYQLRQVISKTKVDENITFNLTLKQELINFVKGDATSGYKLLNETNIDCGTLCSEFETALHSNPKKLSGKFVIHSNGSIKLVEIL